MEDNALIGVISKVIIPVQNGASAARSQRHGKHPNRASNIGLACGGLEGVAEHTHHSAWYDTKIFLDSRPALHRRCSQVLFGNPILHDQAKLRHLQQRYRGNPAGRHISLDLCQLVLNPGILIVEFLYATKSLREIHRLDADTGFLQQLLAKAYGEERCWAGAQDANPSMVQPAHDPTGGGELAQILTEAV